MRTYITVEGEERNYKKYKYDNAEKFSKPKCPICDTKTTILYYHHIGRYKHMGLVCNFCNHVYITKPGCKTFRATWKKSMTGEVINRG